MTIAHREDVDKAIESYYRARAQGKRMTLKQVAELSGFSYNYVREKKVEYDRRGGWGSKMGKQEIDTIAILKRLREAQRHGHPELAELYQRIIEYAERADRLAQEIHDRA